MKERELYYNAVECLNCHEILVSHSRHDYVKCSCENETFVDGGLEYIRYGGKDLSLVFSRPIYSDSSHETIRENLCRGSRGKDGKQPLLYIKLKDIDNQYLEAIIAYEEQVRPNNKMLPIYREEQKWRQTL